MLDNLMTSEEFDESILNNKDLNMTRKNNQIRKSLNKKSNTQKTTQAKATQSKQSKNNEIKDNVANVANVENVVNENPNKKGKGNNLKISFLGGIGEIGKNMTVLEYGKDIVVIDCGVMFPSLDMLGIDLVVPDITYLVENQDKIRGFVVTHGHEDHIGSVPYVVNEIKAPIYASKMTCGLIKKENGRT